MQQLKRGRKTPPVSSDVKKNISNEKPKEVKEVSTNNQFKALLMEEGEIPPLEIITVKIEEEES